MKRSSYLLLSALLLTGFISCSCTTDFGLENTISVPTDGNGHLLTKQKIKPLNGMGNGPLYVYKDNHFLVDWCTNFKELNIPLIRYHDVEFTNEANNQAVNVSKIFPDFNADASLPESYHFEATDTLLSAANRIGAQVIFRLGENIKSDWYFAGDNTPPADFEKWACIAERIIAHYEDGWNNGYHYSSILWEVWNEPDNASCWDGTIEQYCEFYKTVCRHVLSRHPDVDISPAYALHQANRLKIYQCISENQLRISHCFVHMYTHDFSSGDNLAELLEQELLHHGLDADFILSEWNYRASGTGEDNTKQTYDFIQSRQGAAWVAKQLIGFQAMESLAASVYYASDMPGFWTGLYKLDYKTERIVLLPTYDVFRYFGKLYRLGNEIVLTHVLPKDMHVLAASDGKEVGIMVVNYTDKARKVCIGFKDMPIMGRVVRINDERYEPDDDNIHLLLEPYDVCYIDIVPTL